VCCQSAGIQLLVPLEFLLGLLQILVFSVSYYTLQDSRLQREMMTIVAQDCPLENKMLTVCYGCDMVNVSFVNFAAIGRNIAKVMVSVLLV